MKKIDKKIAYIICGLPNSGQKELYSLLKESLSDGYVFNPIGQSVLNNTIKTCHTINLNLFDLTKINQLNDSSFKFIICLRDIRNILCDKFLFNGSETYVNDWNCRYVINDLISTTSFGLRYYYNIIKDLTKENCCFITYEELLSDPISIQLKLLEFDDFNFNIDFDSINIKLNNINWKEDILRIKNQICKFPEIMESIQFFNYEFNNDWTNEIYEEELFLLNTQITNKKIKEIKETLSPQTIFNNVSPLLTTSTRRPIRNQPNKIGSRRLKNKQKNNKRINIKFITF